LVVNESRQALLSGPASPVISTVEFDLRDAPRQIEVQPSLDWS